MESKVFSSLEIDAIGEILNISLGASATAVSAMLNRRVDITIPKVIVSNKNDFEFSYMEPAVGVEIHYVSGLSGKNIMLLKRDDVKVIVEILMGVEIPDEEFELNDLYLSAIREVMNQMMGSSSTALSEVLGDVVNISTPTSYEINTVSEFKEKNLSEDEEMVVVRFILKIEDAVEVEFLNIMAIDLAKKLLSIVGFEKDENTIPENEPVQSQPADSSTSAGGKLTQEEIEALIRGSSQAANESEAEENVNTVEYTPVNEPPKPADINISQQKTEAPVQVEIPKKETPEPRIINVKPASHIPENVNGVAEERPENMDLIMDVELEISVEIGRTKKYVKEILEYNQGSLVVLDKLAGEQVDVFVNGQCIAKGDVVVVDDCFGVRITEVLKKS